MIAVRIPTYGGYNAMVTYPIRRVGASSVHESKLRAQMSQKCSAIKPCVRRRGSLVCADELVAYP